MRRNISLVINGFIAVAVPIAWVYMATGRGTAPLTAYGLWSLKYFTVLSNILMGAASLVCFIFLLRNELPEWLKKLRFASVTSVGLTFFTVMLFLGPVFGYGGMFQGANLIFHLVVPLLAMADFALVDKSEKVSMKHTFYSVIPMLLYGTGYYANILINGVGSGPTTNDWYGFAMFGMQYTPLVFLIMALATWLIAAGLRFIRNI